MLFGGLAVWRFADWGFWRLGARAVGGFGYIWLGSRSLADAQVALCLYIPNFLTWALVVVQVQARIEMEMSFNVNSYRLI